MSRFLSLCLVLCVSSFVLASSVEVVYVAQGTSIVTYNVDPQTLNYTQVGTLSIKGASTFGSVVPAPNDHFIYVMAADATQTTHLYVYATDAKGAPQSRPTQMLYAKSLLRRRHREICHFGRVASAPRQRVSDHLQHPPLRNKSCQRSDKSTCG